MLAFVHLSVEASAPTGWDMGIYGPEVPGPPDAPLLDHILGPTGRTPADASSRTRNRRSCSRPTSPPRASTPPTTRRTASGGAVLREGRAVPADVGVGDALRWGFHFDAHGRAKAVPVDSTEYERLTADPSLRQLRAGGRAAECGGADELAGDPAHRVPGVSRVPRPPPVEQASMQHRPAWGESMVEASVAPERQPEHPATQRLLRSYEQVLQYAYRSATSTEPGTSSSDAPTSRSSARRSLRALIGRIVTALDLELVPTSHRARWSRWRLGTLPRARWFLRFFVVDHLRRSLTVIHRRQAAQVALGNQDVQPDREAVGQYLESLPSTSRLLYSTTLVAVTVVVTRFVLLRVPGAAPWFGAQDTPADLAVIEEVLKAVAETAADITSSGNLLTALMSAPPRTIAFVAASLATVLYVELRWLVPAFRLHRLACNLDGHSAFVTATPASWSVQRATGTFRIEQEVANDLEVPPPREVPFDLIVSALALPWALFLAWMLYEAGNATRFLRSEPLLGYTLASGVLGVVAIRGWWLIRAWRRRATHDGTSHLPVEVQVEPLGTTGTSRIVTQRDPVGLFAGATIAVGVLIGVAVANGAGAEHLVLMGGVAAGSASGTARFTVVCLVVAPLWWLLTRDLAAFLEPSTWRRHLQTALATGAMAAAGILLASSDRFFIAAAAVLISWSVVVTYRRLQWAFAHAHADVHPGASVDVPARPPLRPWALAASCVAFPVALALLQHAMNVLWAATGSKLDRPGCAVVPAQDPEVARMQTTDVSAGRSIAQNR